MRQQEHKKSTQQMVEHWDNIFANSDETLSVDQSGYSLVCYRHVSASENRYVDWLQRKTIDRLLTAMGTSIQGKEVLDIGTGVGRWAQRLAAKGAEMTAIDWSERVIQLNQRRIKNVNFLVMSCTSMEFPEAKFDLVTSITVLHHIPYPDQKQAIAEICRVTRSGGYVIILESKTPSNTSTMFPHKLDEWLTLFASHSCQPVAWTGYEYSLLLRLIRRLYKGANSKAISRFSWVEKLVIAVSYPLEWVCMRAAPLKAAKQVGILFQKS